MPLVNTVTDASTGSLPSSSGRLPVPVTTTSSAIPYTPIGFGKPLCIEILAIYTGKFKIKGLFKGNRRDMLCVSGVKAAETFNATPRAINLLQKEVADNTYLEFSAFANATPYVYYKNAVDTNEVDVTIELTVNAFNDNLLGTVAGLVTKAAGLPMLMPAAGKVLAGAQLVNVLQSGAGDLFTPSTFFNETVTIRFDTAGMPVNTAQCRLVCRQEDASELSAFQLQAVPASGGTQMRLVNSSGIYDGEAPYVVLNIDGAARPELQSWTATLASSSILSQFYGSSEQEENGSEMLQQALGLYNDYNNLTKATAILHTLKDVSPDSPQYAVLQMQYLACINNIQNSSFMSQVPKFSFGEK